MHSQELKRAALPGRRALQKHVEKEICSAFYLGTEEMCCALPFIHLIDPEQQELMAHTTHKKKKNTCVIRECCCCCCT